VRSSSELNIAITPGRLTSSRNPPLKQLSIRIRAVRVRILANMAATSRSVRAPSRSSIVSLSPSSSPDPEAAGIWSPWPEKKKRNRSSGPAKAAIRSKAAVTEARVASALVRVMLAGLSMPALFSAAPIRIAS